MSDTTPKRSIKDRVKPHLPAATIGAIAGATVASVCTFAHLYNRVPASLIKEVMEHGKTTIMLTGSGTILDVSLHQYQ